MDKPLIEFSGRVFRPEDIQLIQWVRNTYPKLSRNELAATVCELLEWTTPAGKPKIQQCSGLLQQLESEGVLKLPTKQKRMMRTTHIKIPEIAFDTTEVSGKLKDFDPIRLEVARAGKDLKRWRAYVDQYHMLGDRNVFGSRLHYFIRSGDKELGCLQFSASSWALSERDDWIGWCPEDKKDRLYLILNNSRYLIFPWVRIKYLASKALSLVSRQIQQDWLREFCYAPVLLETFVDTDHFRGTCYKAANWIYLGETRGRGRNSSTHRPKLSIKDIYVYPLQRDFRAVLTGDKPCQTIHPDDQP